MPQETHLSHYDNKRKSTVALTVRATVTITRRKHTTKPQRQGKITRTKVTLRERVNTQPDKLPTGTAQQSRIRGLTPVTK
jgi:hypothetical protein